MLIMIWCAVKIADELRPCSDTIVERPCFEVFGIGKVGNQRTAHEGILNMVFRLSVNGHISFFPKEFYAHRHVAA